MIADTFRELKEPKKEFWIDRMYRNYAKRFYDLTKSDWIEFMGSFDDIQAYGHYKDEKSRKYCLLIRDHAVRLCSKKSNKAMEG